MRLSASGLIHAALKLGTILYLGVVILLPLLYLMEEALAPGWDAIRGHLLDEIALAALSNTFVVVATSLVVTIPLGILAAYVLVRDRFPGRLLLDGLVDLPFAAPAAIGALALILAYGPRGILGPMLEASGVKIVFALPGMVLATIFVTLPFVIRETMPLLEAMGVEAEEAARTLGASRAQTFFQVTLPGVREGVLYGAAQSYARALGEFGAILVISGNVIGKTQTTPIHIYDAYIDFEMEAAYTGALVLVALSFAGMALLELWKRRWRS